VVSSGHNVEMTGITRPSDEHESARQSAVGPDEPTSGWAARQRDAPPVSRWIWALEHAQDVVAIGVGLVLIALAAVVLISAIVDFADGADGHISSAAPVLLDRVLLVLILVEIVYTVVLSLRAHRLVAQPFIVVGLIAVIREILVVLTPGSTTKVSASELALLIGMVAVFVAGLIAVSIFEKGLAAGLVTGQHEHDHDRENPAEAAAGRKPRPGQRGEPGEDGGYNAQRYTASRAAECKPGNEEDDQ
jgi:uncharacterized membrane protein (DUF373 family)